MAARRPNANTSRHAWIQLCRSRPSLPTPDRVRPFQLVPRRSSAKIPLLRPVRRQRTRHGSSWFCAFNDLKIQVLSGLKLATQRLNASRETTFFAPEVNTKSSATNASIACRLRALPDVTPESFDDRNAILPGRFDPRPLIENTGHPERKESGPGDQPISRWEAERIV